jgi:hypothetical protein
MHIFNLLVLGGLIGSACGGDGILRSHQVGLEADFRQGLPSGWVVDSGALGEEVWEFAGGLYFPQQPPNRPKGSIASPLFWPSPGALWIVSATSQGQGPGGASVDWYDASGRAVATMAVVGLGQATPGLVRLTAQVQAFPEAAQGRLRYGVDTFGERLLAEVSISSPPGN